MNETDRILAEYARRGREIPADFYSLGKPANLYMFQQRARTVIRALGETGFWPLAGLDILEVGCGTGQWLADLEAWGASRTRLHGIDLDERRAAVARARLCDQRDDTGRIFAPGADIRTGDASRLPWPDRAFDVVLQSTVFTSILDPGMRREVAAEMVRVVRPEGVILSYDFRYDNPSNANVRALRLRDIRALFHGCRVRVVPVTLAPPLARRLVPVTWIGALLLEKVPWLCTHYLAVIRRGDGPGRSSGGAA